MTLRPVFGNMSHASKFLMLLMILAIGALLSTGATFLIAAAIWGKDALSSLSSGNVDGKLNLLRIAQIISQMGIFILPVLFFAWLTESKPLRSLGFVKPLPRQFIIALLIIPVAGPMINELVQWNEAFRLPQSLHGLEEWMKASEESANRLTEDFLKAPGWNTLWINVLMIGILPAIGEELLFRSVLIGLLRKYFRGSHWPVIISSLIFSAIHLQFYGFIPRFVLGMVLGYLYVWSGSVWLPMLAHLVNNVSTVIISFLYYNHYISSSVETIGESPGWPWVMLSVMLTLGSLMMLRKLGSGRLAGYWRNP
ncbi:MAG: CPBP family intramembrane glutamic endopeptidase [Lentimicrobium sp.]|jgi:membrane protease YdiL (CAAX protease family)|nr:CPBP family intramembrane glutamic endopeptidase [Lentimicrobium sp.]